MNKKTLIISIILIALLAGLLIIYFLIIKPSANNSKGIPKDVMENEFFSVKLLDGWVQVQPISGAYVMAIKDREQLNNATAKELGFASYYSVVGDTYVETSIQDYLNKVKASLEQNFTGIALFDKESHKTENGETYFIESQFSQQGINLKSLLAINIKNENVWIVSFNTLDEKWDEYQGLFYEIADSFEIK